MTQKKMYKKFGERYMLVNVFLLIPGGFIFFKTFIAFRSNMLSHAFIYGGIFALYIICWAILDYFRKRNFRCPECNKRIRKTTIKQKHEGDPINYYCPDCDIEWETGLHIPPVD